ncbi:MAG: AIR synthase-related protein [Candidatus Uhrbacteria bacterium]|nr:AIR synthase-related protein [Candidatus Uhrbacteria bacterium]
MIRWENICHGDVIVIFRSSGIHANGLTLARKIAGKLPRGYLTLLPFGHTYGEALLAPTKIYVRLIEMLQDRGISIRYAVNVTGHGWRKLMRAPAPWSYVIEQIPEPHPVFEFIRTHNPDGTEPISDTDMYGNLNMGAGFAIYIRPQDVQKVLTAAAECGIEALQAGHVEKGPKCVVIKPKNLIFNADTLQVR